MEKSGFAFFFFYSPWMREQMSQFEVLDNLNSLLGWCGAIEGQIFISVSLGQPQYLEQYLFSN